MPALEFSRATVTYPSAHGGVHALGPLDLSLGAGESLAVIGPSGSGKSTLLFAAAGLVRTASGRVLADGSPVSGPHPGTALILQDYGLFPWKSVLRNAALGLELRGVPRAEADRRAEEVLARLGLAGFERRWPAQLSGGQRQRVAIARALALDADTLLLDEPFSSLDALTREELQDALLQLWRDRGLSVLLVTHSIEEAVFLGRRIVVLSARPGMVFAVVDNPGVGGADYRGREGYYEVARDVRARLDEAMTAAGGLAAGLVGGMAGGGGSAGGRPETPS